MNNLFEAIRKNDIREVKRLLDEGSDPNIQDEDGNTPLVEASLRKRLNIINLLLEYEADPKIENKNKVTPEKLINELLSENPNQKKIDLELSKYLCTYFKRDEVKKELMQSLTARYGKNEEIFKNVKKICPGDYEKAQRATPDAIFASTPLYPSRRVKTSLDFLFNEVNHQPQMIQRDEIPSLEKLEEGKSCFCLDAKLGFYKDIYIPVTTYRPCLSAGSYTSLVVDPQKARFLYYYWEPESPYLLFSPQTLVFRNKIQAYYYLISAKNESKTIDPLLSRIIPSIKKDFGLTFDQWINLQTKPEKEMGNYSSWYRPLKEKIRPPFEGFGLDFLDRPLGDLAIELGFDVLVFTHQPGCYTRLVTELLDVRTRIESIRSISIAI